MPYQIRGFSAGAAARMTSCTRCTSDRSGWSIFEILSMALVRDIDWEAGAIEPAEAPVEPRNSRRREVSLDVRLTVADRDAIRRRAHVLGVKPSAWARAVMLDALDSRSSKVAQLESNAGVKETAPTSLAPAVEQLRRVGVNLNQALRKGPAVDDGLLHEVMVAVDEVRASLGDRTRT